MGKAGQRSQPELRRTSGRRSQRREQLRQRYWYEACLTIIEFQEIRLFGEELSCTSEKIKEREREKENRQTRQQRRLGERWLVVTATYSPAALHHSFTARALHVSDRPEARSRLAVPTSHPWPRILVLSAGRTVYMAEYVRSTA